MQPVAIPHHHETIGHQYAVWDSGIEWHVHRLEPHSGDPHFPILGVPIAQFPYNTVDSHAARSRAIEYAEFKAGMTPAHIDTKFQAILTILKTMSQALDNLNLAESSMEQVIGAIVEHQLAEINGLKQQLADGTLSEASIQNVAARLTAFQAKINGEVNPAPTGDTPQPAAEGSGADTGTKTSEGTGTPNTPVEGNADGSTTTLDTTGV